MNRNMNVQQQERIPRLGNGAGLLNTSTETSIDPGSSRTVHTTNGASDSSRHSMRQRVQQPHRNFTPKHYHTIEKLMAKRVKVEKMLEELGMKEAPTKTSEYIRDEKKRNKLCRIATEIDERLMRYGVEPNPQETYEFRKFTETGDEFLNKLLDENIPNWIEKGIDMLKIREIVTDVRKQRGDQSKIPDPDSHNDAFENYVVRIYEMVVQERLQMTRVSKFKKIQQQYAVQYPDAENEVKPTFHDMTIRTVDDEEKQEDVNQPETSTQNGPDLTRFYDIIKKEVEENPADENSADYESVGTKIGDEEEEVEDEQDEDDDVLIIDSESTKNSTMSKQSLKRKHSSHEEGNDFDVLPFAEPKVRRIREEEPAAGNCTLDATLNGHDASIVQESFFSLADSTTNQPETSEKCTTAMEEALNRPADEAGTSNETTYGNSTNKENTKLQIQKIEERKVAMTGTEAETQRRVEEERPDDEDDDIIVERVIEREFQEYVEPVNSSKDPDVWEWLNNRFNPPSTEGCVETIELD